MKPQTAVDFPYYNGVPVALRPWQWAVVMGALAAGFAALQLPDLFALGGLLPAVLCAGIPLAALRAVAGPHWRSLFRPVHGKDAALALAVAIANIGLSSMVALLVTQWFTVTPNPAGQLLAEASSAERMLFFAMTVPQLLGEELLTVLPFLGVMAWLHGRVPRGAAIVVAWLLSSLLFGLLHLSTYDWNLAQCLLIIGSARLVLTVAYLATRNLWVATLAHIISDWLLLITVMVLMPDAAAALSG